MGQVEEDTAPNPQSSWSLDPVMAMVILGVFIVTAYEQQGTYWKALGWVT
jgi:hypothetical protein